MHTFASINNVIARFKPISDSKDCGSECDDHVISTWDKIKRSWIPFTKAFTGCTPTIINLHDSKISFNLHFTTLENVVHDSC
jgi:hypothetical protein